MRSNSHGSMTRLPQFPNSVSVTLRLGTHNGREQLWAPYVHERTLVKLIVNFDAHDPRLSKLADFAGVKQTIYPFHSPNGHVVFCTLEKQSPRRPRQKPRRYDPERDFAIDAGGYRYDPAEDEEYDPTEASEALHRFLGCGREN